MSRLLATLLYVTVASCGGGRLEYQGDCGGTEPFVVQVVEGQAPFEPMVPLPGATVIVDCAAGRLRAATDANGMARFEGLDLAGDPPDVSTLVPDHPDHEDWAEIPRTQVAVGLGGREVPQPYVVRRPFWTRGVHVEGAIRTIAEGDRVICWCDALGAMQDSAVGLVGTPVDETGTRYAMDLFPGMLPARMACLEQAGDGRLVGYGEEPIDGAPNGPDIEIRAVLEEELERFDVTLRYDESFEADREGVLVLVEDRNASAWGVPIGLHEWDELRDGEHRFRVAWIPGAKKGDPFLRAQVFASRGWRVWGRYEPVPQTNAHLTFEVDPPAHLEVGQQWDRMDFIDPRWSELEIILHTGMYLEPFWWIQVPPGTRSWEMPPAPDDRRIPSSVQILASAFTYDEPPDPGEGIADLWWWFHNVRSFTYGHPRVDFGPLDPSP